MAKEIDTETNYIIQDHLGSSRVVMNEENSILSSYNFDAFGNLMPSTVSEEVAYQYTGQEYDSEIDLHNFRARFYDSDLMRFYSVDPAMQTASPYLFCGNNPVMYVDEDGLWCISAQLGPFGFNIGDSGIGVTFAFLYVGYDWEKGAYQQGMKFGVGAGFDVGVASLSANIGVSAILGTQSGFNVSGSVGCSASIIGYGVIGGYTYSATPTNYGWQSGGCFYWDYGVNLNEMKKHHDNRNKLNNHGITDLGYDALEENIPLDDPRYIERQNRVNADMEKKGYEQNLKASYHKNGKDGQYNMKYQKGKYEVIINARTGFVDNRAINMGTYNYGNIMPGNSVLSQTVNGFAHFWGDMMPYYVYGNSSQDYIIAPHWNPVNFPIRAIPPEWYRK